MGRSEADARWERLLRALGLAVLTLQKHAGDGTVGDVALTEIRFRLDADNRTSVLVILKGYGQDGLRVGFVGALDLESAVIAAAKALAAGVVRWREDRPYSGG